MDKRKIIHLCVAYKRVTSDVRKHRDWNWRDEKIFLANGNQKRAEVAVLTSDETGFNLETVIRDKQSHYIMIKGPSHLKDVTIVSIYMHPTLEQLNI